MATFTWADFKSIDTLKGISHDLTNVIKPTFIKVIPEKNLILIIDRQNKTRYGHVFTLDSFHYIKSFISNGSGSNDQLLPRTLQYSKKEKKVYVFDFLRQNIFYYSIDSIELPGKEVYPLGVLGSRKNKLVMRTDVSRFVDPLVIPGTNTIVGMKPFVRGELVALLNFYDRQMNFNYSKGDFPDNVEGIDEDFFDEVYVGSLKLSEEGDRLIYNYYNTDIINEFDTSGNLVASVQGPDIIEPQLEKKTGKLGTTMVPKKSARFCYVSPARMIDKKIFVLYNGLPVTNREESCNDLFEFSETLTPLRRFKLSERVFNFDIDWKGRKIYGLTEENKPRIISFQF